MYDVRFLELYIHIPFCEKKCNYCDFVSFDNKNDIIDKYIEVLIKEIEAKSSYATNRIISSIYIGGGTPSSIDSSYITKIMDTIYKNYTFNDNVEITIESNPHSTTLEKFKAYRYTGINRLSLGVQSANDDELKILGRIHTYKDFMQCYDDAIHAGFSNINFDIINGFPTQTDESYKQTLKQLIKLNPKHLSIYNLIVEPNTPFYQMQEKGTLELPSEDTMTKIDDITEEMCSHFHYEQYEVSNYAKSGYTCLHNLGYWSDIEYIGLGLNSSSYIGGYRYKNFKDINRYLFLDYSRFKDDINKFTYYEEVTLLLKKDMMSEFVYLGMRKVNGISAVDFYKKFDDHIENIFNAPLTKYINMGLIIHDKDRYYLSKYGMKVSNPILADFLL